MARKRTPEPAQAAPELRVSRDEAAGKIDDRIGKGREFLRREIRNVEDIQGLDDEYDKWNDYNRELLTRLFTTEKFTHEYSYAGAAGIVMSMGPESHAQKLARVKRYISGKIGGLESIKERLELIPEASTVSPPTSRAPRLHTNRAFIVHGHDEGARETVARLLQRLGVEPIILHEQATEGRTIVEKLERYSDVDFAIILMTTDDMGASKKKPDDLQPRARQNVVLELGYFVGKLGRDKVCALYEEGVEMPSDYLGVGYVKLDAAGGWHLQLARELRAAGFSIDMNAL